MRLDHMVSPFLGRPEAPSTYRPWEETFKLPPSQLRSEKVRKGTHDWFTVALVDPRERVVRFYYVLCGCQWGGDEGKERRTSSSRRSSGKTFPHSSVTSPSPRTTCPFAERRGRPTGARQTHACSVL